MVDLDERGAWEARRSSRRVFAVLLIVGAASGLLAGILLLAYFIARLTLAPVAPEPLSVLIEALPRLTVRYGGGGLVIGALLGLGAAAGRSVALLFAPRRVAAIVGAVVPAFVIATAGAYGFMHVSGEFRLARSPHLVEVAAGLVGALVVLVAAMIVDRRPRAIGPRPSAVPVH
jgi:hypothetical protein